MHIWDCDVETKWNYHDKDESGDSENYVVAAENFDKACEKVKKLALSKSRKYKDEEDDSSIVPVSLEFVKVERGTWIDG